MTMEITPIIDEQAPWKQRFRLHHIVGYIARCNSQRGLIISNQSSIYQLYAWDIPNGTLHQLTKNPSGQAVGELSSDGRFVYYLNTEHGKGIGHYVQLDIDTNEQIDLMPNSSLNGGRGITSDGINRIICYITADDINGMQLFTQSTIINSNSTSKRIYQTFDEVTSPTLSYDGDLIVIQTMNYTNGLQCNLLVFDTKNDGQQLGKFTDGIGITVSPKQFAPMLGDSRLLATSDRNHVNRPFIWCVRTGERIELNLDSLGDEGNVEPQDWSSDGEFILLLHIQKATHQLYRYNITNRILHKLAAHPSGTFSDARFGPNETIVTQWENSITPKKFVELDVENGALKHVIFGPQHDEIPYDRTWHSVTFPSSDGQLIQGWLALPRDDSKKLFPTIIGLHGGPFGAVTDAFDQLVHTWLDHGFACLLPNYRGSTTFGWSFEHKIYHDVGHWEVEDIAAARMWLIEQQIADSKRILVIGGSYGGYLTLLALGKQPYLWAGGIAWTAITDWAMQYNDIGISSSSFEVSLFGGTPEQRPELYTRASPITYIEQVTAPVLIFQGNNDSSCLPRQMQIYETKMREMGKDIEVIWFDGGHQSNDNGEWILRLEKMLHWAHRVFNTV